MNRAGGRVQVAAMILGCICMFSACTDEAPLLDQPGASSTVRTQQVFRTGDWVVTHVQFTSEFFTPPMVEHVLLGRLVGDRVVDQWYVDVDRSCLEAFDTACRQIVDAAIDKRDDVVTAKSDPLYEQPGDLWPFTSWSWVVAGRADDCGASTVVLVGSGGTERPLAPRPIGRVVTMRTATPLDYSFESIHVVTPHAVLTACGPDADDPQLHVIHTTVVADFEGAPVRATGPHLIGTVALAGATELGTFEASGGLGCPLSYDVRVLQDDTWVSHSLGAENGELRAAADRPAGCS